MTARPVYLPGPSGPKQILSMLLKSNKIPQFAVLTQLSQIVLTQTSKLFLNHLIQNVLTRLSQIVLTQTSKLFLNHLSQNVLTQLSPTVRNGKIKVLQPGH